MIRFERTEPRDAEALAQVSEWAFDDDVNYGAPGAGGPPGYRDAEWQKEMMRVGIYYKIIADYRIIGGFVLFDKGGGHFELGRIFVEPGHQNRGIGAQAIGYLEESFPQARRWTLDTPCWNLSTQHFYKKRGMHTWGRLVRTATSTCMRS